ncbi:MAG: hypothetical protein PHC99_05155 [Methylococcales bacterium]|nr:hypothetical protein [Methylococcales bacterium]
MKETKSLKKIAASVYLCQLLTFMLAGLPLLIGVALNFYNKEEAIGTWIESHFEWQIKTAWIALAGFSIGGIFFALEPFFGVAVLISTVMLMVYRIVIGWNALNDDKTVDNSN